MNGSVIAMQPFVAVTRNRPSLSLLQVTSVLIGLTLSGATCAAGDDGTTFAWTDSQGGPFEDSSNWQPGGGPPGSLDSAYFDLAGGYDITFAGRRTLRQVIVNIDSPNLLLGGFTCELTGDGGPSPDGQPGLIVGRDRGVIGFFSITHGTVACNAAVVGSEFQSGGTVYVHSGGQWVSSGTVAIGYHGSGHAVVYQGSTTTSAATTLGVFPGSDGTIDLLDQETQWICAGGELIVGDAGTGSLTVSAPAVVRSDGGTIGRSTGGNGIVVLEGSLAHWTSSQPVLIGVRREPSNRRGGLGRLILAVPQRDSDLPPTGGRLIAPRIVIGEGGTVLGVGTLQGDVVNGGDVQPGVPTGDIRILGDYEQTADGVLEIDLGGRAIDHQHDALDIEGEVTLGGELRVALVDGFVPQPGDQFTIITTTQRGATIGGRFSSVIAPRGMMVEYQPDRVALVARSMCGGADLDHNGAVNGIDLALLLGAWTGPSAYAPCPPHRPADLNHDCKINGLDLALLLGSWGPCSR